MRAAFATLILLASCLAMASTSNFSAQKKEIALTFDDAPTADTVHFNSSYRTKTLIQKLKRSGVSGAMIFANPCKGDAGAETLRQLKLYTEAGHTLGNHTCSHPRLDDVGFESYAADTAKADAGLNALLTSPRFFRYPYLNEGTDVVRRNQMRQWLQRNGYRNGMVSVDNDDYVFSAKINEAKKRGLKVDYKKIEQLFLRHVLGAVEYYDNLAVEKLGRSPKHVLLLHEVDATVMYIENLVHELRARGWKIISAEEAFQDPLYFESPANTYANNGIIPQVILDRTGEKHWYNDYKRMVAELEKELGLSHRL